MAEIDFHTPNPDATQAALQLIRKRGFVVLRRALAPGMVTAWHSAFIDVYGSYLSQTQSADALSVGHLRKMITLELSGSFGQVQFWANPALMPVLEPLLGPRLTLDTAVCVTSLPGAAAQRLHLDHPNLFDTPIDTLIPPWSVGVFIPLVRADAQTGTTEVEAGSHLGKADADLSTPVLDPGDVMLLDYRTRHRGGANLSDKTRPMVVLSYTRPWFMDSVNFGLQQRLKVPQGFIDALDDGHRALFAKVRPEIKPMQKLAARQKGQLT